MVKPFEQAQCAIVLRYSGAFIRGYVEHSASQRLLYVDLHGFNGVICFNPVGKCSLLSLDVKLGGVKAEIKIGVGQ